MKMSRSGVWSGTRSSYHAAGWWRVAACFPTVLRCAFRRAPGGEGTKATLEERGPHSFAWDAPTRDSQSLFESLAARAKAFAEKLEFTAEVEALGITEEQAKALGIGVHRAHVYCAMRYESGVRAGFLHIAAGKVILPKNLLSDQARNVVTFPKRA